MKIVFYTMSLLLLMASCQSSAPDATVEVITIDPTKTESLHRSEVMTFQKIIRPGPLEGEIRRIIPLEGGLLVVSNELSLMDNDGQLLHSIGHRGNGPGEYLTVAGVGVHDELIRVLDGSGYKILDYNPDGVFLIEHPINLYGQAITLMGEKPLVYGGMHKNDYNHRMFLFDADLAQFTAALPYDEGLHYLNLYEKTNFFTYNDSVRFLWAYDYNIYDAQDDGGGLAIKPRYSLDFGPYKIPDDFFQMPYDNIMEFEMALLKTDYAGRIAGYYEDDHQLMFGFRFREKYLLGIYSKETRSTRVVDTIVDDVLFAGDAVEPSAEWFSLHFHGNQAFLVMDPWQASDRINTLKESMTPAQWQQTLETNPVLAALSSGVDENDGPLIIVFGVTGGR